MDDRITIRKAKVIDLPVLQKLSQGLFLSDAPFDRELDTQWPFGKEGKSYLLRRIRGRKGTCLIAELKSKIIGYATGGMLPVESWRPVKRSELDNLFVIAEYRSCGIGKLIMEEFFAWSKKMGAQRIVVHAMEENRKAIAFYGKNKFYHHHIAMERKLKE